MERLDADARVRMPAANDYGPVAHLYDTYVRAGFDLEFLREEAAGTTGPVLELTAGTGRVSSSLLEVCSELTCVDISREMLQRLVARFHEDANRPLVVCADVRRLPVRSRYALALLPFNSFSELVEAEDQRLTLREIRRVLVSGGRLIVTLHNPWVRARTITGVERRLGSYGRPGGGHFEVWVRESLDAQKGVAQAVQTYRFYADDGRVQSEQSQHLRFRLIEREVLESMAADAGLEVVNLYGDYDRSRFRAETSPYMIWILREGGYRAPTVPT